MTPKTKQMTMTVTYPCLPANRPLHEMLPSIWKCMIKYVETAFCPLAAPCLCLFVFFFLSSAQTDTEFFFLSVAPDGSFQQFLQLQNSAERSHTEIDHGQQQQREGEVSTQRRCGRAVGARLAACARGRWCFSVGSHVVQLLSVLEESKLN